MARFGKYGTLVNDAPAVKAPRFGKFGSLVTDEEEPDAIAPVEAAEPVRPTFGESVGRGADLVQSMAYGAVEATGELVGSDTLTDVGRVGRKRNEREAGAAPEGQNFLDIRDAGDLGAWMKDTIGEQIPMMAPSLGGAAAGAAVGSVVPGVGTLVGGAVGAFVPSLVMGVGEVQGAIKEKDPNAEAPGWAFAGGSAIAALDSVLPGKLGTRLMRHLGVDLAEEVAERTLYKPLKDEFVEVAADGAKSMATEAITEALQEAIGEVAASKGADTDIDWANLGTQMIEAGAAGALMGGSADVTMGAAGRALRPRDGFQRFADSIDDAQFDEDGASIAVRNLDPNTVEAVLTPEEIDSEIPNDILIEGKAELQAAEQEDAFNKLLDEAKLPGVGSRVRVNFGDGRIEGGEILGGFDGSSEELGLSGRGVSIKLDNGEQVDELLETLQALGVQITPELEEDIQAAQDAADSVQSGGGVLPAAAGQAAPGAVPSSPSGAANAPAIGTAEAGAVPPDGPAGVATAAGPPAAVPTMAQGSPTAPVQGLAAGGSEGPGAGAAAPGAQNPAVGGQSKGRAAAAGIAGGQGTPTEGGLSGSTAAAGDDNAAGAKKVPSVSKERADELANKIAAKLGGEEKPKSDILLRESDNKPWPTKEAAREAAKGKKFRKKRGRGWIPTKIEGGYGLKLRTTVKGARKQGPRSAENTDILTFIASHGGIDSAEGDDVKGFKKMTQAGQLVRKGGRKWDGNDGIVRLLRDNEYFPGENDPSVEEVKRVLADAIRHKKKIYRPDKQGEIDAESREAQDAAEEADARAAILAEADESGITFSETDVAGILGLMGERGLGVQAALDAWADEAGVDTAIELEQATGDEDYGDIPFEPIEAGGEAREGVEGQTRPGDAATEGKTARGPPDSAGSQEGVTSPTFEEVDTVDGKRDQAVIAGAEKDGTGAAKAKDDKAQQLARLKGAQKKMRAGKPQEEAGGMFAPKQEDLLSSAPSDYGSKNKLVTKDRADEIAAKMAAKFKGQLNTGIDPELLAMGTELAIYHIEAGARKFLDFVRRMRAQMEGLGVAWPQLKPYVRGWYLGAQATLEDKGGDVSGMDSSDDVRAAMKDIDSASAASSRVEQDSGNADAQDEVGAPDVSLQSGRAGSSVGSRDNAPGERGRDVASGEGVVPGAGAAPVGERGDSEVRASKPDVSGRPPEHDGHDGGGTDSQPGQSPHGSREGAVRAAAPPDERLAAAIAAQKAAMDVKVVPADKANIDATLPFLRENQREDVLKAENRLYSPDGWGFLFTNGTGTGKTYVAGGLAARFWRSGQKNILIVVPSQDMAKVAAEALRDHLQIPAGVLDDTQSNKTAGVVATTYANLQDNPSLAQRTWDLVIADESQKLMSSENGEVTRALSNFRAITGHPDSHRQRAEMQLHKEVEALEEEAYRYRKGNASSADIAKLEALRAKIDALAEKLAQEPRSRVVFLSATPFAYTFNVDYAQGYLFDWHAGAGDDNRQGYNAGSNRDRFYMQHFGYRMRYNRLTKPDAGVDTGVMERQFHEWLKSQGVLSGRRLDVPFDYDRKFVLVDDAVGNTIDKLLDALHENPRFAPLGEIVRKRFNYLARVRLLEAIKANHAIPYIKKQHALGRKVVVFHDYNEGGGFNPFDLQISDEETAQVWNPVTKQTETVNLKEVYAEFNAAHPEAQEMKFGHLGSPLATLQKAFPNALVYNGTIPNKQRTEAKLLFNTDGNEFNIIIVQAAAGEFGISLHDTTGKHQRVLVNLGLPTRPVTAIQEEGRIYRDGQASDAAFRYFNTGTNWERYAFATRIAERASTAENLALGNEARTLRDAFINAFLDSAPDEPGAGDGKGGKEADKRANADLTEWQRAVTFYHAQQKQRGRRDQREGQDYFPTPEPVGLKMVQLANLDVGEKALEPSAGHGAIARFFPEHTDRTLIEPSNELASHAGIVAVGAKVLTQRFEDLHLTNKYDAIVMNPPYGMGGKTAMEHVTKAMKHLRNGGRIVALIPTGGMADRRFDEMMESEDAKGIYLAANIKLPQVTFQKAGTGVMTRIVVLEKQTDADVAAKIQQTDRDYTDVETIPELFERMENLEIRPRLEPKTKDVDTAADADGNVTLRGIAYKLSEVPDSFQAKPKGKMGADAFRAAAARAGDAGGAYIRGAGYFAFPTKEARDTWIASMAQPDPAPAVAPQGQDAAPAGVKFVTGEVVHAKKNIPLYVAQIETRVEGPVYQAINRIAKKHGGYYSAFRGRGAMPGFQFESQEQRAAFLAEASNAKESRGLVDFAGNFFRWFGESKVVDADGNPLVVYHGTNDTFDVFGANGRDGAYFFTEDRRLAQGYGKTLMSTYLRITNPAPHEEIVAAAEEAGWDDSQIEDEYDGILLGDPNVVDILKAKGYDGWMGLDGPASDDDAQDAMSYAVFSPTQIKSTENNGNWDGENPNIRESRASTNTPAFRQWFDGSAVVEADGSPRIMFHGTRAGDIREFRYTRNDLGMHFGTIEQANDRLDLKSKGKAEGNVIPVYLSIKNPLRLNDPGVWSLSNMYQELVMDPGAPLTDAEYHSLRSTPQLRAMLEAKGYDGIVYKNRHEAAGVAEVSREIRRLSRAAEAAKTRLENRWSGTISELLDAQKELPEVIAYEKAWPGLSERRRQLQAAGAADSYIAFRPEQIKSVFNQGTFDTGSRKISERRGMLPAQAKSIDAEAMAARLKEVGLSDKVIAKIRDWSKDPNAPNGRYLLRMIEISQQATDQAWVLNHEIVHALKDLGLISNIEWLKLKTLVMNNPALMADIKRRYPDLTLDEQIEEAISDTFAEWKREQGALSFLAKMWDRIQAFFRALRGDYQDAGEIFQAIDRGYIGRRDPVGEMSTEERLAAAYHGSPHDHDGFDLAKVGTGEGNASYGWGLYFAGNRAVAEHYRQMLTREWTPYFKGEKLKRDTFLAQAILTMHAAMGAGEKNARWSMTFEEARKASLGDLRGRVRNDDSHAPVSMLRLWPEDRAELEQAIKTVEALKESDIDVRRGRLYQVELAPAETDYLLWDKPLSEQSPTVRAALKQLMAGPLFDLNLDDAPGWQKLTGGAFYDALVGRIGLIKDGNRAASEALKAAGIRGNKYLDGVSRNRPLKEIKRAFLDALPEDADGTELVGLLGSGTFDDKQEALIRTLAAEGWWGFDYPSQAISAALSERASNWDPGPEVLAAIADLKDDGTFNYVIFDDADVRIVAKESRGNPRIQGNLSQETAINKAIVEEKQGGIVAAVKEAYAAFRAQDKTEWLWATADEFAGLLALGKTLNPDARDRELGSYVAARLSRHSAGQIEAFLKHGAPVWDAADQSLGLSSNVKGLYSIVEPLFKSNKARLFEGYAYARRVSSQNLIAEGREHNLTDVDVQELLQLGQQHPEFVDIFDKIQEFKKAVNDAAEAMGLINAQQRATWEQADHVPFYRAVEDDERKSPRAAKGLAGQSPQIRRLTGGDRTFVVVENATGKVVDRFDKRLKANMLRRRLGQNTHSVQEAGQPIVGVIENLAQNVTHLINASIRNHAAVMAVDEALAAGWAKKVPLERARALVPIQVMIKALEGKNLTIGNKQGIGGVMAVSAIQPPVHPGNGIIAIRRQGQVEYYEVEDKLVYSALTGLYRGAQHPILRFFGAFKNILTRGVTAMPDFMVRNFVRDSAASWIQSEERGFNVFKEVGKTLRAVVTRMDDPRVKAIMAAGGDTGWYQNAPEETVSQLRKLERDGRIGWLAYANPLNVFKVLERMGRASEIANRIVQYDETLKATGSRRQAAFDAADILDFQLKGGSDFMQAMTAIVPFLNARIQGLYKLGRYGLQKKSRKSFMAKASVMMAFSLILALINAGDDEEDGYNDLPEYLKDSTWSIPLYRIYGREVVKQTGLPMFLHIPKPFELGMLFGTVPERMVQAIAGNDSREATLESVARGIIATFAFNPAGNPITMEFLQQWANKDVFRGEPIVGTYQQFLEPEDQYNAGTSQAARAAGKVLGVSPARLEHAVRGFLGTAGMWFLEAADVASEALGITPPSPKLRLDETEIVRSFVSGSPVRNSKWVDEFYNLRDTAEGIAASIRQRRNTGDVEGARALQEEYRGLVGRGPRGGTGMAPGLDRDADVMARISKQMKEVRQSREMTPEQKRTKLDELIARRNQIARERVRKWLDKANP